MSEELRPCPFCGGNDIVYEEALSVTYCNDCGGELDEGFGSDWNTRPIEDALNARIAELEHDLSNKEIEYTDLWDDMLALQERIAELEAEIDQLTAHDATERQDDKSPNDTQTDTVVYGKWIPVSERLPEKQKLTIGFTDNSAYVFFEIVNDDEMGLVMYPYQNRKGTVTHWMPLPTPPEVK